MDAGQGQGEEKMWDGFRQRYWLVHVNTGEVGWRWCTPEDAQWAGVVGCSGGGLKAEGNGNRGGRARSRRAL